MQRAEVALVVSRYGTRTLELLKRYYQRELTDLSNEEPTEESPEDNPRAASQLDASTSGRADGDSTTNGGTGTSHTESCLGLLVHHCGT